MASKVLGSGIQGLVGLRIRGTQTLSPSSGPLKAPGVEG